MTVAIVGGGARVARRLVIRVRERAPAAYVTFGTYPTTVRTSGVGGPCSSGS